MLVVVLIVGGIGGAVSSRWLRARERRRYPQLATMARLDRVRHGWAAARYSPRGWVAFGLFFAAFAILETVVLLVNGHGAERVVGVAGLFMFTALAIVSLVQAARSRHLSQIR